MKKLTKHFTTPACTCTVVKLFEVIIITVLMLKTQAHADFLWNCSSSPPWLQNFDALQPVGSYVSIFVHGCASEHGLPFCFKKWWNFLWIGKQIEVHQGVPWGKMWGMIGEKTFSRRFLYSFSRSSYVRGSWFVSHKFCCNQRRVSPNVLSCQGVSTSSS